LHGVGELSSEMLHTLVVSELVNAGTYLAIWEKIQNEDLSKLSIILIPVPCHL
jgi:predicted transporter